MTWIFVSFKSCFLDTPRNPIWWLIPKPYLHSGIANAFWYIGDTTPKIVLFQFLSIASRGLQQVCKLSVASRTSYNCTLCRSYFLTIQGQTTTPKQQWLRLNAPKGALSYPAFMYELLRSVYLYTFSTDRPLFIHQIGISLYTYQKYIL